MARIVLVTGGCRSGKSRHAQNMAENAGKKRLYIATAPVLDEEMAERVAKHREMRQGRGWETCEESTDLAGSFHRAEGFDVILCDCLTLWVNNLLYFASQEDRSLEEEEIVRQCAHVTEAAKANSAEVIFVTNEVGMGIVPAYKVSRQFRDLAGRCNQEVASVAEQVILMVSGLPIFLKGLNHGNY